MIHSPAPAKRHPPSIGLLSVGDHRWIAGINYTHNIIRALALIPQEDRLPMKLVLSVGVSRRLHKDIQEHLPNPLFFASSRPKGLRTRCALALHSLRHGQHPEGLERVVSRHNLAVLFPSLGSLGQQFPIPWIGWVPDFQHKRLPHFFSPDEVRSRDRQFIDLIAHASHVIVSSRDAYEDLMRWFPAAMGRVSVFPFVTVAPADWYNPDPKETVTSYRLPQKFLIFPSQFWAHKNHLCLFQALRLLKERGPVPVPLVCTGYTKDYRSPEHFARLQAFLIAHRLHHTVHILGLLPRLDQVQLLRASVAVVQPSLFEGWSALVEDARTLGKRIYLSDLPVHREQDPPNASFFRPEQPEELAALIARDWNHSDPGPSLQMEQELVPLNARRATHFARTFLHIVERAIAAGRS